jgi:2-phospho-L-lactate transferase/gluconeogenesis factor (CofD/UPF0052 family)
MIPNVIYRSTSALMAEQNLMLIDPSNLFTSIGNAVVMKSDLPEA